MLNLDVVGALSDSHKAHADVAANYPLKRATMILARKSQIPSSPSVTKTPALSSHYNHNNPLLLHTWTDRCICNGILHTHR